MAGKLIETRKDINNLTIIISDKENLVFFTRNSLGIPLKLILSMSNSYKNEAQLLVLIEKAIQNTAILVKKATQRKAIQFNL